MGVEVVLIISLLAVLVYLIARWVFKKIGIGNETNRRFIAIIPAAIIAPLLYILLIYIWVFVVSYYPSEKFDKQKWITNTEERYKMSEDIIYSEMLIGKTKEEITDMLGDDFFEYDENHIGYYLGFVPTAISIDPDILDIYFKDGKVIEVEQHTS